MSPKNFSPVSPAVWPAIGNIYIHDILFYYIYIKPSNPIHETEFPILVFIAILLYSLDPNEAAVQALNLFKTRARLCETSEPSKQTDEAMEVTDSVVFLENSTVWNISRDTLLKDDNARSTTVPFKVLSDQV